MNQPLRFPIDRTWLGVKVRLRNGTVCYIDQLDDRVFLYPVRLVNLADQYVAYLTTDGQFFHKGEPTPLDLTAIILPGKMPNE